MIKSFESDNYINLKGAELFWKIAEDAEIIDAFASASDPNDPLSIGAIFNSAPEISNKWLTTYMNKVSMQKCENKLWKNALAKRFLKGALGVGESIEDTLFNLIKSIPYNMNDSGSSNYVDYTQKKPEHAFYTINMDRQYIQTKYEREFKKAFISWDAFNSALAGLDIALANSIETDFFLLARYVLAKAYIKNNIRITELGASFTNKSFLEAERNAFDGMKYMSTKYAKTEIPNFSNEPVFITDYKLKNRINVNEYSSAFGVEYEKLAGSMLEINAFDFASWELKRLNQLIYGNGTLANDYDDATAVFTATELARLKLVKGIVLDPELIQFYQNDVYADAERDPYGRKTNYIYGYQEIWAVSPFACAIAFAEPEATPSAQPFKVTAGTYTAHASNVNEGTLKITGTASGEEYVVYVNSLKLDDCAVTTSGTLTNVTATWDAEEGAIVITTSGAATLTSAYVTVTDGNSDTFKLNLTKT